MSPIMCYSTCNKKIDVPMRVHFGTSAFSWTLSVICFAYDIPGGFLFILCVCVCVCACVCVCVSIGAGFEEEFSTFS
jgi:hypothetical protein